jgi:hypothetical protein
MTVSKIINVTILTLGIVLPEIVSESDRKKAVTQLKKLVKYLNDAIAAFQAGNEEAIRGLRKS